MEATAEAERLIDRFCFRRQFEMRKKTSVETEKPGNPQVNLRLPPEVRSRLEKQSSKRKPPITIQALIVEVLANHVGVEVSAPARGRPTKSPAKAD